VVKSKEVFATNQEVRSINTRSTTNFHLPACNLTIFQKGAYYSGIKLFNHLPQKIKSLSNEIKLFKPALKQFLTYTHFIQLRSILNTVTVKNQGFRIGMIGIIFLTYL
jgi:hypothetical protein